MARPLVNVYNEKSEETKDQIIGLPAVFKTPIRPDVVNFVHQQLSFNHRQPYCVSDKAGKKYFLVKLNSYDSCVKVPI